MLIGISARNYKWKCISVHPYGFKDIWRLVRCQNEEPLSKSYKNHWMRKRFHAKWTAKFSGLVGDTWNASCLRYFCVKKYIFCYNVRQWSRSLRRSAVHFYYKQQYCSLQKPFWNENMKSKWVVSFKNERKSVCVFIWFYRYFRSKYV